MASTSLTRTSSASATKGTLSMWVKRSKLGATQDLHNNVTSTSSNYGVIQFDSNDQIEMMMTTSGSHTIKRVTNRKFRDTSAWYHFVFVTDVNNSTAQNRIRIYVNGVEETSFSTNDNPSGAANRFYEASASNDHVIGANSSNASNFDGLMSHVYNIVDTVYTPSAFGSTDSTTGEWKINTSPSVTFGSQGYLILKDGKTITDQSSNSNDFTLAAGTLIKTEDCPDNVFATNNPICNIAGRWTITNGNNTIQHANSGAWTAMMSSIAPSVGKYYMEAKITGGASRTMFGVMSADTNIMSYETNLTTICLYYNLSGGEFQQSGSTTSGNNYGTFADNDIAGIALDCTNKYISIYKNGSALVTNHTIPTTVTGPIGFGFTSDSNSTVYQCNYGNGYYGTTAVTTNSGNGYAGAEGKSIFSYQPPTGYSALNTRGLNE